MARNNAINYVKNILSELDDNVINDVYEKMCISFDIDIQNDLKRRQKSEYIKNNITDLDQDDLTKIHKIVSGLAQMNKREENMYTIMLEILNDILDTFENDIGRINSITDFVNINKNNLVSENAKNVVKNKYDVIFNTGYDKKMCRYYDSKRLKNGHMTILKGMTKQLGYVMSSKQKNKMINGVSHCETFYSIT